MHKKITIILALFLSATHQQFAAFSQAAVLLQRFVPVINKSVFTEQLLSISDWNKDRCLQSVRLFAQLPLDKDVENKIYKFVQEDGVVVKVLVSPSAVPYGLDTIFEMQDDEIDIEIAPEHICNMVGFQKFFAKRNKEAGLTDLGDKNLGINAALISYVDQGNIILLGKSKETLAVTNDKSFVTQCKKFDSVFETFKKSRTCISEK